MIRIATTTQAIAAIAATMPVSSVAYEPTIDDRGERHIWREPMSATSCVICAVLGRATAT